MLTWILLGCVPTCDAIKDALCAADLATDSLYKGWHWVDQHGVEVTEGPDLFWLDPDGYRWSVVVATAGVEPWLVSSELTVWGYAESNCGGPRYAADVPGRHVPFAWPASTDPDHLYMASEGGQPFFGYIESFRVVGGTICQIAPLPPDPHWWWEHTDYQGNVPAPAWTPPLIPVWKE